MSDVVLAVEYDNEPGYDVRVRFVARVNGNWRLKAYGSTFAHALKKLEELIREDAQKD